jgi:hypothetical protein
MRPILLFVALEWIAAVPSSPDPVALLRLVGQLGSDSYAEREAASRGLDAAGELALPAVRQALRSSDPEIRRRARDLAEDIEFRAAAPRWAQAISSIRRLGARVRAEDERRLGEVNVALDSQDISEELAAHLRTLDGAGPLSLHIAGDQLTLAGLARLKEIRSVQCLCISPRSANRLSGGLGILQKVRPDLVVVEEPGQSGLAPLFTQPP